MREIRYRRVARVHRSVCQKKGEADDCIVWHGKVFGKIDYVFYSNLQFTTELAKLESQVVNMDDLSAHNDNSNDNNNDNDNMTQSEVDT